MTVLMPEVGPLVASRTYLMDELAERGIDLPVGVNPPSGNPRPYALLSRPGGTQRGFLGDYLIRVRVYDADAVRLEHNADLLHRLMLAANRKRITTPVGSVWVTGATPQTGPMDFSDDDSAMFGMQFAVFWTIGLRPER